MEGVPTPRPALPAFFPSETPITLRVEPIARPRVITRASHTTALPCRHRAPRPVASIQARTSGVHVETLHSPLDYTPAQLELACAVAQALERAKLVLVERPER
jgi:hypothetical protein